MNQRPEVIKVSIRRIERTATTRSHYVATATDETGGGMGSWRTTSHFKVECQMNDRGYRLAGLERDDAEATVMIMRQGAGMTADERAQLETLRAFPVTALMGV